ncbi:Carbamoyl-phosphate synthase large chain [Cupriavidus yeoncheonensis]|uniref:Carbamoyl-phosphate synthase large chain n=1 Tax=Cupriavidus yeoncheonensis TaxID=1462994 RepID=A0A916ITC0_9BURK|nr:urea carboxylase [Cupriavidus yeoncheonensis]CAG2136777.1 Carbamoyl-phosphate synthase large chain [Cupriavidus yeoncheonensis]
MSKFSDRGTGPAGARFDTVLIANRGAIACRIIRTLRQLGLRSVAVYSEADAESAHVALADAAVCIGPAPASQSYLDGARILEAARETGAGAIHPGYGFLSENPGFARDCEAAGIAFIGPTPGQMQAFGLKHTARALAEQHAVPLLPGSGLLDGLAHALAEAARIGYPVMLKSSAGGGGIGMRLVRSEAELVPAVEAVERLARANFKDAGLFLEKFVERARHIEVQLFGDGQGNVIALGERDCSAQRRNQKVVEETPAPGLDAVTRSALTDAAVRLGRAVRYRSAGTVEFVLDADTGAFYFLEVNTRLQVEHGVTEQVTGVDLVAWMVKLARGDRFALHAPAPRGASIQVRLYAEDPARNFQPSAGLLTEVAFPGDTPGDIRVESWVSAGTEVPAHYDPMLAKLIVTGTDRADAVRRLQQALAGSRVGGIETNLRYLRTVAASEDFVAGRIVTRSLGDLRYQPNAVEVLEAGVQTTVQDWPGRVGYWDVGVPPSGPMDDLSLRIANRLVGNAQGAAGLECTLGGPTLRFWHDAVIAVCGAPLPVTLDDRPLAPWVAHRVRAGSTLAIGAGPAQGSRAYLAVRGGFDVPRYLGSRSTFTLGQFGGHGGRTLRVADVLHIGDDTATEPASLPESAVPSFPTPGEAWEISVLYGPHGAPDFFTEADIDSFFAAEWEVHYNSSRTGVRLIGPKPQWARPDGGEAGLHPSNIHDNAYAIGAIDFTGDMPVILGPDGPSLGGFVCPAVVAAAERWKLGQLRPGARVRFRRIGQDEAGRLRCAQDALAATLAAQPPVPAAASAESPVVFSRAGAAGRPGLVMRQAGDRYLLVELGDAQLDIGLRMRIHALHAALQSRRLAGIVDLTPGIRSLQLHFDPSQLDRRALVEAIVQADDALGDTDGLSVPSRTVWLPLSWDDSATRLAIDKYMQSVRPDAPWCPSNIEFIRRINGLASVEEVRDIVFAASYLVMGLGDVYLGAPVATPLDPRHRLVTTKYNPARTWTPENAVGIGGAYMCVYGMEGPGGYQFVGRTLQMWNRWRDADSGAPAFEAGKPWLLRCFDKIRFYPVSEAELAQIRKDFPAGRYPLRIEAGSFAMRDYQAMLDESTVDIAAFRARQQAAFAAERERWRELGHAEHMEENAGAMAPADDAGTRPEGARAVCSAVPGSVWKLLVEAGSHVKAGDTLVVVESMKMEFAVTAPCAGTVWRVGCAEGAPVGAGQEVVVIVPEAAQDREVPEIEVAA